jgi:hypothetical protein
MVMRAAYRYCVFLGPSSPGLTTWCLVSRPRNMRLISVWEEDDGTVLGLVLGAGVFVVDLMNGEVRKKIGAGRNM